MADKQRRLILAHGEKYIDFVDKPSGGRTPEPPRSYAEARERLKTGVSEVLKSFRSTSAKKKLPEEAVFCMRMHPDATAKSYEPIDVFTKVPELRSVGSRTYRSPIGEVAQSKRIVKQSEKKVAEVLGRLIFVQSSPEGFERFSHQLDVAESALTQGFRDDVRRIERIDALSVEEQVFGFDDAWTEGRVELVFHPSKVGDLRQSEFLFELFDYANIDVKRSTIRPYPGGPTFVSCRLNRKSLKTLTGANPLRSAHPLRFGGLKNLRSAPKASAPKAPGTTTRSTIKVGMFDGGIDPTVPLLQGHVEQDDALSIRTPAAVDCIDHGTAVAGALLHGPLNGIDAKLRLPSPPVYVVSFRALPTSDPQDLDLYESIDVIEQAVPARKDIKVFNLSFGPDGPIEADDLSRFTFTLDQLAHAHKVTFYVAVGNDGTIDGENRIQSPSDLANGCGVAAHTWERVRADYSCVGPGREGAKIKPDLAAFGGCENHPFHLVSTQVGSKVLDWGTSYASPLAARLGAQASEAFDRSSALLGRALLVHTAVHPAKTTDHLLGHGCILPSIDDVVLCEDQAVTVVFQGDIVPTRIVKLPIPWPSDLAVPGKVQVRWTVAALTPVDSRHPGDYTCVCVEDTFYPDDKRYTFTLKQNPRDKKKTLHVVSDKTEIAALIKAGWKKASFPNTTSGNVYRDENDRRKLDCKWDSIVRREIRMQASGIDSPFLTLHAMGRNDVRDRFDYVVVVTIRAESFKGDLYTEIRNRFPALAPIRLRTEAEIRVQI